MSPTPDIPSPSLTSAGPDLADEPQDLAPDTGADWFVVRTPGAWQLTPVPGCDPSPVELADILARMDAKVGRVLLPVGEQVSEVEPLDPQDTVSPVWMVAGLVGAGHLQVENAHGDAFHLTSFEVAILDRLREPAPVDHFDREAPGGDGGDHRIALARLVAAGCASVAVSERSHPTAEPPDAGGEASSSGATPSQGEGSTTVPPSPERSPSRSRAWIKIREAYLLSSKLRPVRAVVDRVLRRTERSGS